MAHAAGKESLLPSAPTERIQPIDVLRGVAILGILVVNMAHFSSPVNYLQMADIQWWTGPLNRGVQAVTRFFAEGKFMSMFAFLLGLGAAVQAQRAEAKGRRVGTFLFRRFFILLIFGLLHAIFLWPGDILFYYALFGFALTLFFRNRRPRTILIAAGLFLAIPLFLAVLIAVVTLSAALGPPHLFEEMQRSIQEQAQIYEQLVMLSTEVYSTGSFSEVTAWRTFDFSMYAKLTSHWLPVPFSMMLLGFYMGRRGIFQNLDAHKNVVGKLLRWTFISGIISNGLFTWLATVGVGTPEAAAKTAVAAVAQIVGSVSLSLFYIFGITHVYEKLPNTGIARSLGSGFAAVGRLSLTHYLLHSVVFTTLFYGYGFGLYGQAGPAVCLVLALSFYAFQLAISLKWLQRFRYGPAEWLWRRLTYGKTTPTRSGTLPLP